MDFYSFLHLSIGPLLIISNQSSAKLEILEYVGQSVIRIFTRRKSSHIFQIVLV